MCIRTLFSRPAHSNSLVMELLLICLYSKLADFFMNFTFDSHRDLKLCRTQNVKFKYFSRSMVCFQGLFKTNFVFKDFSRLPFIFKYFASLCEPCCCYRASFGSNLTDLGRDVENWFSRWRLWQPPWIFYRLSFSYFVSTRRHDAPH